MQEHRGKHYKSAGKLINELSKTSHIYFKSEFKTYSIGPAQIRTLLFIAEKEGISQLELSKNLNLDKSSITSQLSILERNGYIKRLTAEQDARMHRIMLTDKTHKILESLKMVFASWTEILLDGFSEEERTEVFSYLDRMQANALFKLEQLNKLK